jgi:centrosomal protein CEP76
MNINPARLSLKVSIGKGRAFLSHLDVLGVEQQEPYEEERDEEIINEDGNRSLQRSSKSPACFYVVDILCNNQRARSAPVRADVEPEFTDVFIFDVDVDDEVDNVSSSNDTRSPSVSLKRLMENADSDAGLMHIVLMLVTQTSVTSTISSSSTTTTTSSSSSFIMPETISEVIGTRTIDFRSTAYSDSNPTTVLLQLTPVSPGPQSTGSGGQPVPVGLLPLSLQFLPLIGMAASPADGKLAADKSSATASSAEKAFLTYSKSWWNDFKSANPSLKKRSVTIFAENETGAFSPTPSFLTPLIADRVINSPAEAARFVSLLPYRETDEGGLGPKRSIWHSIHSVIAKRAGGAEDHAVLLASLLLGLGMDAYVAMGSRSSVDGGEEEAIWVITRYAVILTSVSSENETTSRPLGSDDDSSSPSSSSPSSNSIFRVNCWDPLTGHRSPPGEISPSGYTYSSVSSVFSHDKFFACCSIDNGPSTVSWDLEDTRAWKGMDSQLLRPLPHAMPIPLSPPTLDCAALSVAVEASLRSLVESHRAEPTVRKRIAYIRSSLLTDSAIAARDKGLTNDIDPASTLWDDRLSFTLQQALAAYEAERLYGVSFGSAEFAASVKRSVPRGSAFRGFPVLFNHLSPSRMIDALLAANVSRDIIETPIDDKGAFALRVSVSVYCENVAACWVLISVRTAAVVGN